MTAPVASMERTSVHIQLVGDVQGYGIRPTVSSLAIQHDLHGSVRNCRQGVDIVVCGSTKAIDAFRESLRIRIPFATQNLRAGFDAEPTNRFQILESVLEGPVQFVIPRDRVICEECLRECQTPGDRRFGYAMNGCAKCGPRYSIISAMPYDRSRTSLSEFVMCSACQDEFEDLTHRRYHAQTNCCPACGPKLWFEENGDLVEDSSNAIAMAAQAIAQGRTVAVKGLGGYQLICDATNPTSVDQLRIRKHRLSKPLAVMIASIHDAHRIAELDEQEEEALRGPAGPIVLLRSKVQTGLTASINAGFRNVGLMLPTMALHVILLNMTKVPLVVTSGNIEGEPLEYQEAQANQRLGGIADCFLHHDRPIVNPIDDSVVQSLGRRMVTLRAARGLTPIPIDFHTDLQVMALGGQQKSAMALSNGAATVLGPHLGDLDTMRSRERFMKHKTALQSLMNCESPVLACDLHPDFFSSRLASETGLVESQSIQHHHAHIVSAMVENGLSECTTLGFAFDGTGLGSDGTIWGGEVLVANSTSFLRVGHLRTFPLIGGDAAAKQPWRVAVSLLVDAVGEQKTLEIVDSQMLSSWKIALVEMENLIRLGNTASISLKTSSMGRLYDGIAALVCGVGHVSFEGEAAMRLEATCNSEVRDAYRLYIGNETPFEIDWRPMVRELVADLALGVPVGTIAMKFHRAIAECIATVGFRYPELPIVLAGGVFQNRLLVELVDKQLRDRERSYTMSCKIPPNDGGLAIGQLAISSARIERALCV